MGRDIYKRVWGIDDLRRGTWLKCKGNYALICCRNCAAYNHIGRDDPRKAHHPIDQNGEVNPSVVCITERCGYHEFITLGGWLGEES